MRLLLLVAISHKILSTISSVEGCDKVLKISLRDEWFFKLLHIESSPMSFFDDFAEDEQIIR